MLTFKDLLISLRDDTRTPQEMYDLREALRIREYISEQEMYANNALRKVHSAQKDLTNKVNDILKGFEVDPKPKVKKQSSNKLE